MSALNVEQRQVLRTVGGWSIADALLSPAEGCAYLRSHCLGGTYRSATFNGWFECKSKGILLLVHLGAEPVLTVPYAAIAAYADEIPAPAREELRAARDHYRAVHAAYALRDNDLPIGKYRLFDQAVWDAHMAEWLPAVDRLKSALNAALPLEVAEQLDMFAGAL